MRFAMRISLAFGVLMLIGKMTAYFMTGSAAILSDAAESVIHVIAVAFAAFSLRLSTKPAKPGFLYGYERIAFFSAGFEGALARHIVSRPSWKNVCLRNSACWRKCSRIWSRSKTTSGPCERTLHRET